MTQDSKGSGATPGDSLGEQSQETVETNGQDNSKVSYETYSRTVTEAKRAKKELEEFKSKFTEIEQAKLAETGKKDELLDSLKKENSELKNKFNSAVHSFARSRVQETFMSEAMKLGCIKPEIVSRAYLDELKGIDFDDEFRPNREQITALLTKVRNEAPELFSKQGPAIGSHQVKVGDQSKPEAKPISKLSNDELLKQFADVFKQEKSTGIR